MPLRTDEKCNLSKHAPAERSCQLWGGVCHISTVVSRGLTCLFLCHVQGCVEHPIVMTEAPCNPLHCRQMMSELLFECYRVPFVSYGVDGLYSFYHNKIQRSLQPPHTGIVLSSGYHCSHILPVINGRWGSERIKTFFFLLSSYYKDSHIVTWFVFLKFQVGCCEL